MSGGILQLVSYGSADIHLTGNPEITYWRQVVRRYTNFAVESVLQTFHSTADFNRKASVTLSRTGDLVHRIILEVTLPVINRSLPNAYTSQNRTYYWVNKIGIALIKVCELEIGGSRIDRHTSEWIDIVTSLMRKSDQDPAFNRMIGNLPREQRRADQPMTLYIPLQFFFNAHHSQALPLVSIAFHDVRLNFEFRALNELLEYPTNPYLATLDPNAFNYASQVATLTAQYNQEVTVPESSSTAMDCKLYADIIYCEPEERRRFAKKEQEMLVQVVQFLGDEVVTQDEASSGIVIRKTNLNFVHPVKELLWVFHSDDNLASKQYFTYSDVFEEVSLLFNGQPRFTPRKGSYFSRVQPWQHHTTCTDNPIHCFSFSLRPEEPQPSGSMNFSRIDQAHLLTRIKLPAAASGNGYSNGRLKCFALSYNLLRIKSGLAGLAYSS